MSPWTGVPREQGIDKAGNRRLRTVMVELAWLWQRYQSGSAQVSWFRERVGGTGARMRKGGLLRGAPSEPTSAAVTNERPLFVMPAVALLHGSTVWSR